MQALAVQIECLMWVRNGFSVRTQAGIYSAARFRGRDVDMLLLQCSLALCNEEEAEHVMPLLVQRFELQELVRLDCVSPSFIGERPHENAEVPRGYTEDVGRLGTGTPQQQVIGCEEMLRRFISLLSAREWAGDMSPHQRWRMCLIHCLALQDRAHSEMVEWAETCPAASGLGDSLSQLVDEVLPSIATKVQASRQVGGGLLT